VRLRAEPLGIHDHFTRLIFTPVQAAPKASNSLS